MKKLSLIFVIPLFAGLCIMDMGLKANQPKAILEQQSSSIYALAGEFRIVIANLLWIKVEQYHHEFEQKNANWTQNKDLLSFTDIITKLDPKFEEAYMVGCQIYAMGYKKPLKGIEYLERGLEYSPKSYALNRQAALMYGFYLKDYKRALPLAQQAAKFAKTDFDKRLANKLVNTIKKDLKQNI